MSWGVAYILLSFKAHTHWMICYHADCIFDGLPIDMPDRPPQNYPILWATVVTISLQIVGMDLQGHAFISVDH